MIKKILTVVLLFGSFICSAQKLDTDALNNPDNIFIFSLKIYCSTLDSTKNVVYVIDDGNIGSFFPKKINNFDIVILRNDNFRKIVKENKGIIAVRICGLRYKNNQFYVDMIPFSVSVKRKNLNLENGGGYGIYFEYDCDKKEFIYTNYTITGI